MTGNGGCLQRLRDMKDTLSPKERRIAVFLLDFPTETVNMPIDEVAASCGASVSSVIRLCKTMGYTGYKALCRALAGDLATSENAIAYQDIRPGDTPESVFKNICLSNMKAIENTVSVMHMDAFTNAVNVLIQSERIDFYGVGTSALVAQDAQNKFLRLGKMAMANADQHVQLLMAASLRAEDVAVLISYSGETYDTVALADQVARSGATSISVTHCGRNSVADRTGIQLYASSTETMIRSGAMSSRISQMTIIDALYAAVCSGMYEAARPHLDKSRLAVSRTRPTT